MNKAKTKEAAEKRRALHAWKRRVGCADCGLKPPDRVGAAQLVFHHEGEGRAYNVSSVDTRSWDQIVDEMAICDVLCYSCHSIRHLSN